MIKDHLMVGMAELKVHGGTATYTCLGLGSCIGLAAFDMEAGVSGMVHIMLPQAFKDKPVDKPGKFADTGIVALLAEMEKLGANPRRLVMAYAGGAQVFRSEAGADTRLDVGARNGASVQQILAGLRANVIAADTGGNQGRTVTFSTDTGLLKIRTVGGGERPLCNFRQSGRRLAA